MDFRTVMRGEEIMKNFGFFTFPPRGDVKKIGMDFDSIILSWERKVNLRSFMTGILS
jgi:hypothetical protein